jgi:hypothetical protein
MATGEVLDITLMVTHVLEALHIPYLVGGSLASSLYGIPRATQDVDLVADISLTDVEPFVQALNDDFYIDAGMINDAIQRRSSFNIIHLATMFKVDVFILKADPTSQEEMSRRHAYTLPATPNRTLIIASAEDIILQKLYWYELGNRISERQWRDVLGVIKVQHRNLDQIYMDKIARRMGLYDLLQTAWEQVRENR